jgi:hypothetical protein
LQLVQHLILANHWKENQVILIEQCLNWFHWVTKSHTLTCVFALVDRMIFHMFHGETYFLGLGFRKVTFSAFRQKLGTFVMHLYMQHFLFLNILLPRYSGVFEMVPWYLLLSKCHVNCCELIRKSCLGRCHRNRSSCQICASLYPFLSYISLLI